MKKWVNIAGWVALAGVVGYAGYRGYKARGKLLALAEIIAQGKKAKS